jgi:hypothetical protein
VSEVRALSEAQLRWLDGFVGMTVAILHDTNRHIDAEQNYPDGKDWTAQRPDAGCNHGDCRKWRTEVRPALRALIESGEPASEPGVRDALKGLVAANDAYTISKARYGTGDWLIAAQRIDEAMAKARAALDGTPE